jgi:catechol 2,3-dioxygenase-like lactoylglutathione lyase family enzyme
MITGIHHTGIWVSDIQKLLPFYCDILGMEITQDSGVMSGPAVATLTGVRGARVRAVMLQMGGQAWEFLELVTPDAKPLPDDAPYAQVGRGHIAFQVDDIEATYKALEEKGVRFVCTPQEAKGVKFCYFRDPEGLQVEIVEPT